MKCFITVSVAVWSLHGTRMRKEGEIMNENYSFNFDKAGIIRLLGSVCVHRILSVNLTVFEKFQSGPMAFPLQICCIYISVYIYMFHVTR